MLSIITICYTTKLTSEEGVCRKSQPMCGTVKTQPTSIVLKSGVTAIFIYSKMGKWRFA